MNYCNHLFIKMEAFTSDVLQASGESSEITKASNSALEDSLFDEGFPSPNQGQKSLRKHPLHCYIL